MIDTTVDVLAVLSIIFLVAWLVDHALMAGHIERVAVKNSVLSTANNKLQADQLAARQKIRRLRESLEKEQNDLFQAYDSGDAANFLGSALHELNEPVDDETYKLAKIEKGDGFTTYEFWSMDGSGYFVFMPDAEGTQAFENLSAAQYDEMRGAAKKGGV